MKTKADIVAAIASAFCDIINAWLTPAELSEVNRRNAIEEYRKHQLCATHEFCDSNEAMSQAFEKVIRRPCLMPGTVEYDCEIMSAAWTLCKASGFSMSALS